MKNLELERYRECQKTPTHSRWGNEAQLDGLRQVLWVEHLMHVSECIEKEKKGNEED